MIFKGVNAEDVSRNDYTWNTSGESVKNSVDFSLLTEIPEKLIHRLVAAQHIKGAPNSVKYTQNDIDEFRKYYEFCISGQLINFNSYPAVYTPILIDWDYNIISGQEWLGILTVCNVSQLYVYQLPYTLDSMKQEGKTVYEYRDPYTLLKNPERVYDLLAFDNEMRDIIYKLNKSGLSTLYCCYGHTERDSLYILFNPLNDSKIAPIKNLAVHLNNKGHNVELTFDTAFVRNKAMLKPLIRVYYTEELPNSKAVEDMLDFLSMRFPE